MSRALPVAHPSCGLARGRRGAGRARPLGSARGAGRGRPERPAGWYVGGAGQPGTRRAAAAGGRGAGRSRGPAGEVIAARKALTEAQADVDGRREAVVADAEAKLAGYQDVVASYASAVYRDGGR